MKSGLLIIHGSLFILINKLSILNNFQRINNIIIQIYINLIHIISFIFYIKIVKKKIVNKNQEKITTQFN